MIFSSPSSPLIYAAATTFDSTSEGEESSPCVVHLMSATQAAREIRALDSKLIELTEELALSSSSEDSDLLDMEISHLTGQKERIVAHLAQLTSSSHRKRAEPDLPSSQQETVEEEEEFRNSQGSQGMTRSAKRATATSHVTPPTRPQWWMELYHDFFNLWEISPPASTPDCLSKARRYYADTEDVGKYLIERGFPVLGDGQQSITFLLSEHWVAKVARYGWDSSRNDRTVRHFHERNLDLAMYSAYPKVFAQSRLVFVSGDKEGITYRLYVQERLYGPFIYGTLHAGDIRKSVYNRASIVDILEREPSLRQWAWTKSGVLKCFDYQ